MSHLKTTGLFASLLLVAIAVPARADLIINGGFEDPDIETGTWTLLNGITGWSTVGDSVIEIQDNVAGTPYEGGQFVELDSDRQSTIRQDVSTDAGADYILSFAFAARPGTDLVADNFMQVTWDGSTVFSAAAPDYTPNWTVYNVHVTASSASTIITFGDLSSNARSTYGVYLDAVSLVRKVPEPATLGLLGLGLLGLGLSRKRRRI